MAIKSEQSAKTKHEYNLDFSLREQAFADVNRRQQPPVTGADQSVVPTAPTPVAATLPVAIPSGSNMLPFQPSSFQDQRVKLLEEKAANAERLMKQCADLEHQLALARADIMAWQSKTTEAQFRAEVVEKTNAELQELLEGTGDEDADSDNIDDENPVPIDACHMCRKEIALVAMVPCGHLCICTECENKCTRLCPVCDKIGGGTMRIYFC
ncbi:hypothetical protein Cni_G21925 [Canna indica]|uniref:RING-type domain-containing protein n=1 Tax=Canna indica TaxID=4628 RepID=A0AAQ3QL69_9LILI|nr:hypothetical protein Cni_G21925 [Canna indica]